MNIDRNRKVNKMVLLDKSTARGEVAHVTDESLYAPTMNHA